MRLMPGRAVPEGRRVRRRAQARQPQHRAAAPEFSALSISVSHDAKLNSDFNSIRLIFAHDTATILLPDCQRFFAQERLMSARGRFAGRDVHDSAA